MEDNLINIGLYLSYTLVAVAALTALIFPLIYMVKHFSEAKTTILGIIGIIVLFFIGWLFATDVIPPTLAKSCADFEVSASQFKMVGAGLNTFFILATIATLALIGGELKNAFSK